MSNSKIAIERFNFPVEVTSFNIDVMNVKLFTEALLRVNYYDDNNTNVKTEFIMLTGEDYLNWSSNDNYINEYLLKRNGFTLATPIQTVSQTDSEESKQDSATTEFTTESSASSNQETSVDQTSNASGDPSNQETSVDQTSNASGDPSNQETSVDQTSNASGDSSN